MVDGGWWMVQSQCWLSQESQKLLFASRSCGSVYHPHINQMGEWALNQAHEGVFRFSKKVSNGSEAARVIGSSIPLSDTSATMSCHAGGERSEEMVGGGWVSKIDRSCSLLLPPLPSPFASPPVATVVDWHWHHDGFWVWEVQDISLCSSPQHITSTLAWDLGTWVQHSNWNYRKANPASHTRAISSSSSLSTGRDHFMNA